ncbi:MAG: alpha/beta fold hydrolase [Gammaproteobacteria bacterium]
MAQWWAKYGMIVYRRWLFALLLAFCPVTVYAEALVLIHGYLGSSDNWRESAITNQLEAAGWQDGGLLRPGWQGAGWPQGGKTYYTVVLPSEAPLLVQLDHLAAYLELVRARHRGESLVLVGHSAGGVLARLYMVKYPGAGVDVLITIASPHLGTETAEIGAVMGGTPLAWLAPFLGADVFNRSQALYQDLVRERPGSLLFWLNRQPHPDALYVSIVRENDSLLEFGDLLVPTWSQDMNHVLALRGRARVVATPGGHMVNAQDGKLILQVLRELRRA